MHARSAFVQILPVFGSTALKRPRAPTTTQSRRPSPLRSTRLQSCLYGLASSSWRHTSAPSSGLKASRPKLPGDLRGSFEKPLITTWSTSWPWLRPPLARWGLSTTSRPLVKAEEKTWKHFWIGFIRFQFSNVMALFELFHFDLDSSKQRIKFQVSSINIDVPFATWLENFNG